MNKPAGTSPPPRPIGSRLPAKKTDLLLIRANRREFDLFFSSAIRTVFARPHIFPNSAFIMETGKDFLKDCAMANLPLTENISHRASIYMEEFGLSSGLGVADALIEATAAENHFPLCTGDHRHFHLIRELELSVFRP